MPYNKQPKSTLDKLYHEVKKLYSANAGLTIILERAGSDSETIYTTKRLKLYDDLKDLQTGLYELLESHTDTIMTLESALDREPIKSPPEKTDMVEFAGKVMGF